MNVISQISRYVYYVNTADGNYVLKFSISIHESSFMSILSRDPECNPYIVCMKNSFEISHDTAYEMTKGLIGPAQEPPKFDEVTNLPIIGMYHPRGIYTAILMEPMKGTLTNLYEYGFFYRNDIELIRLMIHGLTGLAYIHSKNIVHNDIYSDNILYKSGNTGNVYKISDFGGSCGQSSTGMVNCGDGIKEGKLYDNKSIATTFINGMIDVGENINMENIKFILPEIVIPDNWSTKRRFLFNLAKSLISDEITARDALLQLNLYLTH